jgi:DNA-binding transcriptional LysR family regulator
VDRLQSMRVFLRVAEEGGFAPAARRLELDPAVVTRLVADLERHLGAPLLQRTTRRVSLTPAGEDYVARIRSILDDIDRADARVHQQAGALRGRLRILSLASIASNILAPGLNDFLAKYPDIQVDIRTTYGPDPTLEDYDLTFVGAYASLPADVVTRKITAAVMALWASPEYLDRHGIPDAPQDLTGHRVILLRRGGGTPERLRLLHPEHRDVEEVVDIDPILVCEDVLTVLRTTLDGVGISSMSRAITAPYVKAGTLRPVLPSWMMNQVEVLAVYPSRKSLAPRARVFLDHILASVEARRLRDSGEAAPDHNIIERRSIPD